ncbi:MAG: hypothetical protein M4579_007337 [Chaenotheca gracillima]|nr:MAG: hypothetical protein M4579_007337 [Chaenotheca gracillima]
MEGKPGVTKAKCWAAQNPGYIPPKSKTGAPKDRAGYVMFDTLLERGWSAAVLADMRKNGNKADEFMKCKSQALAEQASGEVYFLIPDDKTPNPKSAWVGWEFPALQRNTNVDNVWQVDPTDPKNTVRKNIWKKGNKVDTPEPKCQN